jgi:hypothetical protein
MEMEVDRGPALTTPPASPERKKEKTDNSNSPIGKAASFARALLFGTEEEEEEKSPEPLAEVEVVQLQVPAQPAVPGQQANEPTAPQGEEGTKHPDRERGGSTLGEDGPPQPSLEDFNNMPREKVNGFLQEAVSALRSATTGSNYEAKLRLEVLLAQMAEAHEAGSSTKRRKKEQSVRPRENRDKGDGPEGERAQPTGGDTPEQPALGDVHGVGGAFTTVVRKKNKLKQVHSDEDAERNRVAHHHAVYVSYWGGGALNLQGAASPTTMYSSRTSTRPAPLRTGSFLTTTRPRWRSTRAASTLTGAEVCSSSR